MSMVVNAILDGIHPPVEYFESLMGHVSLTFNNAQELQNFIYKVREQGAKEEKARERLRQQVACVPIGELKSVNRRL